MRPARSVLLGLSCLALALIAVAAPAFATKAAVHDVDTDGGLWKFLPEDDDDGRIGLVFEFFAADGRVQSAWTELRLPDFDPSAPVTFRIARDAGTIDCEGRVGKGRGAGTFTWTENPAFAGELRRRGYAAPTRQQQYLFTLHDLSLAFVDELRRQNYERTDTDMLLRMTEHGVNLRYLQGMAKAGYRLPDAATLIKARDHGVDPHFIEEMAAMGYGRLPFETLMRARDHGVHGEYVRGLESLGYKDLQLEEVIRTRDHGVTVEYVKGMRDAGYRDASLVELMRARDHGVDAAYAKRAKRERGELSLESLIRLRDRGEVR